MEELIEKIQQGDELAFKQLTQSIENDLYRVARTRLKDDDDIKDAIQNTMMYIYRHSKKIKDREYFKTWMIRILINECNKIYNLNKKNQKLFDKLVIDTGFISYDNSIQSTNDKINFETIIDKLSYEERIVITLHFNSQYSCSQISKILHTNINTVKSRLTRGTNKLKKFYKEVTFNEK